LFLQSGIGFALHLQPIGFCSASNFSFCSYFSSFSIGFRFASAANLALVSASDFAYVFTLVASASVSRFASAANP
jgi:hypothetical protein